MTRRSIPTLMLLLALISFGCAPRRPSVVNASQSAVEVRVVYSDGDSKTTRLEPGRRLSLDDASRNPREVTIVLATGERFSYSASDTADLLSAFPGVAPLGWKVSDSGVTRLTSQDIP